MRDDAGMFPVSNCLIFAFHLKLDINPIFIMRSFSHTLEQLNDVSYLNQEMLENVDIVPAEQLKNCAINVSNRSKKYEIFEMFSIEL